jgi:hypothetical protein
MCAKGSTPVWNFTDGSSVFYRNQIRQAVLDLCRYIPEYARNNETIYYNQDFAPDGAAHVGALPPMSKVESVWLYSANKQRRFPVEQVAWEHRFKLCHQRHEHFEGGMGAEVMPSAASLEAEHKFREAGYMPHPHFKGHMAISPRHDRFYITPQIEGEWLLSLFWDGLKLDYRDQEQVPFEEEAALAVSWWVKGQFADYIERDPGRAAGFVGQFKTKRSELYLQALDKGRTA